MAQSTLFITVGVVVFVIFLICFLCYCVRKVLRPDAKSKGQQKQNARPITVEAARVQPGQWGGQPDSHCTA